jgi:hypothetical protein
MVFGSVLTGVLAAALMSVVPLAAAAGTALWTRWLVRATSAPRWAAWTAWALVAVTGFVILWGVVAFAHRFVSTLGDESLSPQDRQRLLASGIAEAFYEEVVALGLTVVAALWLGLSTLIWKRREHARP